MKKIREVLRLRFGVGMSARQVAVACGVARSTVGDYERRARAAGLGWPLPAGMDDGALERLLTGSNRQLAQPGRGMPDAAYLKRELSKPNVTMMMLWDEYRQQNENGYGYTQFCAYVHRSLRQLGLVMRQEHHAGERAFMDWAGDHLRIVDADTGEVRSASLFLAVLGCSNFTFSEVFPNEQAPSWILGHVHAYEYFQGVPAITVPDNTRTAVRRPDRYEPDLNPLYADLAAHYGTAVVPARVRHPRDKAKVEVGVLIAERWLLAAVRNRTFFSVEEANRELAVLRERLNDRVTRALKASRRQLFEELDRPALLPLPPERYEWIEWRTATVGPDYHVECHKHLYSVPYQLVGSRVDVRMSPVAVEILHKNRRVASHIRSYVPRSHTTVPEHMPSAHRRYAEWTPARITAWASEIGPATAQACEAIMRRRPHPEQGFRSCMGLVSLARKYPSERLESACRRALEIGSPSYRTVKSLLSSGLDQTSALATPQAPEQPLHDNVRGPAYFDEEAHIDADHTDVGEAPRPGAARHGRRPD